MRFKIFTIISISVISVVLLTTIITLFLFLNISKQKLNAIADTVEAMGNSEILYIVHIEDTISISADVTIEKDVVTQAGLLLQEDFRFNSVIPISQTVEVPIDLNINKIISLDANVNINDNIEVSINDTIPINHKFDVQIFGNQYIPFLVQADIEIKQDVVASVKKSVQVNGDIPVNFDFTENYSSILRCSNSYGYYYPFRNPPKYRCFCKNKKTNSNNFTSSYKYRYSY